MILPKNEKLMDFEMKDDNSLFRIIFNKPDRCFKIKSESKKMKSYFRVNKELKQIYKWALSEGTRFEPRISGINTSEGYCVQCVYSCAFSNKAEVIKPILNFLTSFIDYAFSSHYR